ncbi:hypothetical protein G9C98_005149 [Cotesia typhae]|uniref:histone acetyltransferase n=1 Tax=Cotesia typhae TaxID=2053667 RepID=A0A8J5QU22_9HYME|nr:hypothetical protein G9C98_005149 [Cotesia typhae]
MAGAVVIETNQNLQVFVGNKLMKNATPSNYKQQQQQQQEQQHRECNGYNKMAISLERYNTSASPSGGSLSSPSTTGTAAIGVTSNKYNRENNKNEQNRPQNFVYNSNKSSTSSSSSVTVPLCLLGDVQLRFLCPEDLEEVHITSSSRFYSLAAVFGGVIIGLIVAEIKPFATLNKEDQGILCSSLGKESLVGYILSLGVRRAYRRNGIASLLLEQLLAHVTAPERSIVKAVFLHVLSSNAPAILFYQRCHFRLHSFLPYYYSIRGKCRDGFTYVLYVNGGHAPWGLWDWMRHLAGAMSSLGPCRVPHWIWQRLMWAATLLSYHR